jgi:hypothetical protein
MKKIMWIFFSLLFIIDSIMLVASTSYIDRCTPDEICSCEGKSLSLLSTSILAHNFNMDNYMVLDSAYRNNLSINLEKGYNEEIVRLVIDCSNRSISKISEISRFIYSLESKIDCLELRNNKIEMIFSNALIGYTKYRMRLLKDWKMI